ncbi:hypothetical protein Mkiyose1665_33050 [Mycobacterium kiyosense]|uniref:Uncharacterized protein n=2 Tax=Mycobacteriaceae TaxID=1762 RepID=A0A9P3Q8A3_9MYCO|nr:hypothetical protein [Mycobacterium kiyosense]BDE15420.1 hypothetical protein MKCMC460_42800 [Mycobacterium sp. 20KCMC460]BDB43864.1 hypothetical protein IWGMT90018_43100 [Mycobacterium kiyosense]GLB82692.1 hypothetical protein SRL2020028_19480 [Mycobacterium kiyosense]GLB90155.1 hypothetical protein SRL2020130_29720 [Mycobacterium kiyosense]GLB95744.1 hypothetical protein SRL2020226_25200 [Mycobacterium kiyosense]
MISSKVARVTVAGSIVGTAVAAAIFSAGPALADLGVRAEAIRNTPMLDSNFQWAGTLFKGQAVGVGRDCNLNSTTFCKVYSVHLKTSDHVGWVQGNDLRT